MQAVSRVQWGARSPKAVSHNITPQKGGVVLHYEGPKLGTFDHSKCAGKVKSIQAFHMDNRGWDDIAYSVMVCPHGAVFKCRDVHVRTAAQGTTDGNQNWYAVCVLMGEGDVLTDAAKSGVLDAIDYLRREGLAAPKVTGHRDFHSTGCPGNSIYSWLKAGLPAPVGHKTTPQATPVAKPAASHPAPKPVVCPWPMPKRVLKLSKFKWNRMKGNDVRWLQWHLHITEDGVFGPQCDSTVRSFQRLHKLVSDGIVGNKTLAAVNKNR